MAEAPRIHFASHWLTIQPSLFDFLEDEVGELDDNQRLFVRIAESVELGRIARKYGWCGNGRKPSSRLAMFKMFVMKHVWNFPTTKDALAEVRRCPSMRRLCGWESQSDIPSESTISRTFGDFAVDEIASSLFKDFVKKVARGRIVIHRSIDSTEIDARESAATRDEKAAAAGIAPAEKIRFRNRSGVERVNGHLHDAHGGRTVRVRGHAKVLLHLMLGLLVIAVEQSAQMLC